MPEEKKSKSGEGERVGGCLGQSSNNNYIKKNCLGWSPNESSLFFICLMHVLDMQDEWVHRCLWVALSTHSSHL